MASNNVSKIRKNKTITAVLICILLCVVVLNIYLFSRNISSKVNENSTNQLSGSHDDIKGYIIATKLDENYVLDIAGGDVEEGANVQLWERNTQYAQLFELRRNEDGYYQIININSGKAIAAENAGTVEHTNVCQESVGGSNSQYWKLVDAGNGYYYIIEKNSGLFLDVDNAWTENGTNIKLFSKNEAYEAQKWLLMSD